MSCHYELVHIGVNTENEEQARSAAELFALMFNLEVRAGQKSIFGGGYFECMKSPFLGTCGHIAMRTDDLPAAMDELSAKGFAFQQNTAAYDPDGRINNIYLDGEFSGFAIHILQKKL